MPFLQPSSGGAIPNPIGVTQSTSPWVVSGTVSVGNFPATQPVSGTVAATQGTSPWVVDGSGVVQPVSGPLTDTQLRASAVPVSVVAQAPPASLPLPTGAATDATVLAASAALGELLADPLNDIAWAALMRAEEEVFA